MIRRFPSYKFVIATVFLLASYAAFSQDRAMTLQGTVTVRDIVNIKTQRPLSDQFNEIFNEDESESVHPHQPATEHTHYYKALKSLQSTGQASPAPLASFQAQLDDRFYPPDPHGSVSENYVVSIVNNEMFVQARNGDSIAAVDLFSFWLPVINTNTLFDPRLDYDPNTQRWIMVVGAYPETNHSRILLAVSQSEDPTGSWNLYNFVADSSGTVWADYPTIGFNSKWITVTANIFGITADTTFLGRVYLFNKYDMLNGLATPMTIFNVDQGLSPAATYDSAVSSLYFLETYSEPAGQLAMFKISGDTGSEVMSIVGFPAIDMPWAPAPYNGENFAPQLGDTGKIQCNDDRMGSVLAKNGEIWCTHTVFLPADTEPARSSVLWWAMDTDATVRQVGLIDDPTGHVFYAFPSIAVNKYNDALIGYSVFSADIYPGAGYAYHDHLKEPGSAGNNYIFIYGNTHYYHTVERNRWGDCSATVTDPMNDVDFWTINEFAQSPTSNWGTWWANVGGSDTVNHDQNITDLSLTVTPNPNPGVFDFYLTGQVNTTVAIDIYDALGQRVYNTVAVPVINSINMDLTSYLANGVYLARLYVNGQRLDRRIVIHY